MKNFASNKKTRMKTMNRYSTFSFQDNGEQYTLDPLTQRRSRRMAHSGFTSVSLCLMMEKTQTSTFGSSK